MNFDEILNASLVTPIIFTTRAFVTNLIVVVQFLRYYLMTI